MNTRAWILAFSMWVTVTSWGLCQTAGTPDHVRIEALIRKLGSTAYVQREQARKELETIGIPALDSLRRASKTADMETARRIAELIGRFEEQILVKQILTPKEVHLNLKGASVDDAIQELTKASGYAIQIQADRAPFADKKITLDTGKVFFWQALDRICDEAGLMERIELSTPPPSSGTVRIMAKRGLQRVVANPPASASPGPIVLTNRGNAKSTVSYAGAVRTELRVTRDAATHDLNLQFVVSAEPRLLNSTVEGKPLLQKIIDNKSQKLSEAGPIPKVVAKNEASDTGAGVVNVVMDSGLTPPTRRFTQIRIKEGEERANKLQEVLGKLTLQLDLQNVLLARVEKVLESAGKSVKGANGGKLTLDSIRKLDTGDVEVQVSMEDLTPNPLGNNVIINGNVVIIRGFGGGRGAWAGAIPMVGPGSANELPDLVDAKGQKFALVNVTRESTNIINGFFARSATVIYRANPGQAEISELVLFGTRTHTIDVPFRFENLPLP